MFNLNNFDGLLHSPCQWGNNKGIQRKRTDTSSSSLRYQKILPTHLWHRGLQFRIHIYNVNTCTRTLDLNSPTSLSDNADAFKWKWCISSSVTFQQKTKSQMTSMHSLFNTQQKWCFNPVTPAQRSVVLFQQRCGRSHFLYRATPTNASPSYLKSIFFH